jgi:hypothetical protein
VRSSVLARVLLAPVVAGLVSFGSGSPAAIGSAGRVHPGVGVNIADVNCRVGLMVRQGKVVYAAIPASCTALPLKEGTVQDGCVAATAPVGTPADVNGARKQPILVYNSFTYMQSRGMTRPHKCFYNDLALLQLSKIDARRAKAAFPGGPAPSSVSRTAPAKGSTVEFGNGTAVVGDTTKGGWVYQLTTTPTAGKGAVGTRVANGRTLFGMYTVLPSGTVTQKPAAAYNLYRALRICRTTKGFHHVKLM